MVNGRSRRQRLRAALGLTFAVIAAGLVVGLGLVIGLSLEVGSQSAAPSPTTTLGQSRTVVPPSAEQAFPQPPSCGESTGARPAPVENSGTEDAPCAQPS
jgi:hypothetical protein